MVFISMNDNDQLSRTADYRIQYGAAKSDARGGDAGAEPRSRDQDGRRLAPILTWRRRGDGTVGVTSRDSLLGFGLEDDDRERDDDDDEDDGEEEGEDEDEEDIEDEYMYETRSYRTAQMPREFTTTSHPPSNITTECTDDDPADGPLRGGRNGALNRSDRLYMTDSSGEEDEDDADADVAHGLLFGQGLQEPTPRQWQRTVADRERQRQRQLEQDRELERLLEAEAQQQTMDQGTLAREDHNQMERELLRRRQSRNERRLRALQSRILALEQGRDGRAEEEDDDEEENHAEAEARMGNRNQPVRPPGGELMAPHAKFNIEQGRSRCTIKFDPPVSGRFILLKMWSPHPGRSSNIDIQMVMAKGFAGPRYFPSVSLL
jgi:hypothetical protein